MQQTQIPPTVPHHLCESNSTHHNPTTTMPSHLWQNFYRSLAARHTEHPLRPILHVFPLDDPVPHISVQGDIPPQDGLQDRISRFLTSPEIMPPIVYVLAARPRSWWTFGVILVLAWRVQAWKEIALAQRRAIGVEKVYFDMLAGLSRWIWG